MFNRKDKNNSLETKIIGIAGAGEKSGCTHASIILANRIRAAGCRVAILEENKSKCFQKIAEEFECEISNEGKFVYQSIDYFIYRKPRLLPIILREGYDFLIVDHGNFNDCDKDFYLTNHMHVIMCGSRPWEMDGIQEIFETIQTEEMLEAFHYCFNFAHDNIHLQRNIKKAMGTLQNVYFPPYSEDVFHNSEFGDLDKAIGIFIADNVPKTEGIRLIGNVFGGKKKEDKKPAAVCEPILLEEKTEVGKKKQDNDRKNTEETKNPIDTEPEIQDIPITSFSEVSEDIPVGNVTASVHEEAIVGNVSGSVLEPESGSEFVSEHETETVSEPEAQSAPIPKPEPESEPNFEPEVKSEPEPEVPEVAHLVTYNESAEEGEIIASKSEENKEADSDEDNSQNEESDERADDDFLICYESDEQAVKVFNEIRDAQKFASYKLKNLIDTKNAKAIENLFSRGIQLAFVSVLRGGVEHTREIGKDGAPAISIKNDNMNYELRESTLKELLGKEDYLIDPLEDNYVEF